jgi:hypothetical protein
VAVRALVDLILLVVQTAVLVVAVLLEASQDQGVQELPDHLYKVMQVLLDKEDPHMAAAAAVVLHKYEIQMVLVAAETVL